MSEISRVFELVGDAFQIDPELIGTRDRRPDLVLARRVVGYLLMRVYRLSTMEIGDQTGGLDHSTVRQGQEKLREYLKQDEEFAAIVDSLLEQAELLHRFRDFTVDDVLKLAKASAYSRRSAISLKTNEVMAVSYMAVEMWEVARSAEVLAWQITENGDPEAISSIAQSIREQMAAISGETQNEKEIEHA